MTITVLGAGAIGGLTAAFLTRAEHDVVVVDQWAAHVDAINAQGLKIDGIRGDIHVRMSALLPRQLKDPLDTVFLATKSQHTLSALAEILPLVSNQTCLVSLQNGFNEQRLVAALEEAGLNGSKIVMGAIPNFGGALVDPGHIEFVHEGPIQLGELNGGLTPRLESIGALLGSITNVETTTNIIGQIWSKEIYFSQIVFSALADEPYGKTLGVRRYAKASGAAVREGLDVADACGVAVEPFAFFDPAAYRPGSSDETQKVIDNIAHAVWLLEKDQKSRKHAFKKKSSGVWWDIVYRKRPSEVRWSSGELVEKGKQAGIDVSLTDKLCSMIYEIERGERSLGLHNCDEYAEFVEASGKALP
jgi:2-dehydropantoate 2-reductase